MTYLGDYFIHFYWSFDKKPLLADNAIAEKFISVELRKMHAVQLIMHITAAFHLNMLVSWELVAGGYQGKSMKCVKCTHFII